MQRNGFGEDEIVVLPELSMSHLLAFGTLDIDDFLGRVDTLNAMGMAVQISDFANFHSLKVHLAQFSTERISLAIGIKMSPKYFLNRIIPNWQGYGRRPRKAFLKWFESVRLSEAA